MIIDLTMCKSSGNAAGLEPPRSTWSADQISCVDDDDEHGRRPHRGRQLLHSELPTLFGLDQRGRRHRRAASVSLATVGRAARSVLAHPVLSQALSLLLL